MKLKKLFSKRKPAKKRQRKKREQWLSLINVMKEANKPLGATELIGLGVEIPLSSLYERLDQIVERDLSRPPHQRLLVVVKTEDRVATRYVLSDKGKMMVSWLAMRNRK